MSSTPIEESGIGLRAIFFDNNGTALDDLKSVAYPSVCKIFDSYCLRVPSLEIYRNEIGADFFQFYKKHGFAALPYVNGDDLNKIRKRFYEVHRYEASYRGDFAPVLRELKRPGITVGMCSAEIPEVLNEFLTRCKLMSYFDKELIRGGAWPSKAIALAKLVADLGIEPSQAAYVDDTDDGINAAKEVGLVTFGFAHPTGYNSSARIRSAKPNYVVTNFGDLSKQLHRLKVL